MLKCRPTAAASLTMLLAVTSILSENTSRRCWVENMVGTVKVRRGGSARWIDARPNMPLRQKDAIRTFVESKASVRTSEGTAIDVGENSTVEMSVLAQGTDGSRNTSVRILNGRIMSDVKKLVTRGSSFEFETPTATAAIRGTRVGFDVTSDRTDIRVYEGKVFVRPSSGGQGAELGSNQMTSVSRGQKSVEVLELVEKTPPDSIPGDSTLADSLVADTVLADSLGADTAAADTAAADTGLEDTAPTDTSSRSMVDSAGDAEALALTVTKPGERHVAAPGEGIAVSGTVRPERATVTVRGKAVRVSSGGSFSAVVPGPDKPGEYALTVEAAFEGQSRQVQIGFVVEEPRAGELRLTLSAPADGQRIDRPLIRLAGTVTPGASVEAAGMRIPVSGNGEFMREIPIPDEEGEVVLEVEAALGDKTVVQSRTVEYRRPEEPLAIEVQVPADDQLVCRASIPVRGTVRPVDAELFVNGRPITVRNGNFGDRVVIPADPGEHEILFETSAGDKTLSATRTVRFEPADKQCNTDPPDLRGELPPEASQPTLWFTVYDKTVGDEITFHREIDGSRDSETGQPNSRFGLDLEEGEHTYAVYAEDLAGNRSAVKKGTVRYLPLSVPVTVRRRRPASSSTTIGIPPGRPPDDREFAPVYTVEFSIENLPDDDPTFLKAVIVRNDAAGWSDMAGLIDIDFEFDVPLRKGGNHIVIEVRDINDRTVRDEFDIIVR